ncbi:MAG: hypothetical protein ACK4TB_09095 [Gemmobacter sp.]
MFAAKQTLLAGAALMALAAPLLAEELRGRVTESFGTHVTIEDRGTRWLIRLPEGAQAPAEGTRIIADGTLEGRILTAERIATEAGPRGPQSEDRIEDRPGRERMESRHGSDRAEDRGPRGRERAEDRRAPLDPAGAADTAAPRLPGVTDLALRHRARSGDLHWSGRLGAGEVRVVSAWDGTVKRVETDGAALPRPVIDRALPMSLSALEGAERLAAVTRAEQRPRGEIVLRGRDAGGSDLEIKYDRRGRLDRVERRLPLPGLDRDSVIARLDAAGYRDIGWVGYGARHVEAEAVNPYGERVEVRLNRDGRIDRERLLN